MGRGDGREISPIDALLPEQILQRLDASGVRVGFLEDVDGVSLVFHNVGTVDRQLKRIAEQNKGVDRQVAEGAATRVSDGERVVLRAQLTPCPLVKVPFAPSDTFPAPSSTPA